MDTPSDDIQRRIVQNAARMRQLGLWLSLLPVAVVLRELDAPAIMWALVAANVLVWPWVARRLALANPQPVATERRNLHVDALMAGIWVALMHFSVVPSALLVAMLLMDRLAFGGPRLVLQCAAVFVAGALGFAALNGFAFEPQTSMAATLACVPMLLVYPAAIAYVSYRLTEQVGGQREALEALACTDPLTGLANLRALMAATGHEFRRFRRSGHRSSFMLVDVDRFRLLNDLHGHATGDAALKALADVLRQNVRDTDTCARIAGDRFGVVLADASGSAVGELAERLRQRIAGRLSGMAGSTPATVSIGFAQVDASMRESAQWVSAAADALQSAKAAGRNRCASNSAYGGAGP